MSISWEIEKWDFKFGTVICNESFFALKAFAIGVGQNLLQFFGTFISLEELRHLLSHIVCEVVTNMASSQLVDHWNLVRQISLTTVHSDSTSFLVDFINKSAIDSVF